MLIARTSSNKENLLSSSWDKYLCLNIKTYLSFSNFFTIASILAIYLLIFRSINANSKEERTSSTSAKTSSKLSIYNNPTISLLSSISFRYSLTSVSSCIYIVINVLESSNVFGSKKSSFSS